MGNLTAARKAHQKALDLQPDLQEAHIGLALVEQDMGNGLTANKVIQAALALKRSGIAYLYQGVILHQQNDLKEAEIAWRLANELDPKTRKLIETWRAINPKSNWKFLHSNPRISA